MRTFAVASVVLATVSGISAKPLLENRAACNADNCARLVTGTRAGLPSTRLADCSSFQQVYVVPTPITYVRTYYNTTTVVVTETTNTVNEFEYSTVTTATLPGTVIVERPTTSPAVTAAPDKRAADAVAASTTVTGPYTITQTQVPAYASSVCSPATRYESACSCAGVTRTTSTLVPETSYIYTIVDGPTVTSTSYVEATRTFEYDVTAYDTTAIPMATATGLPCNSTINPHVGRDDTYLINCDVFPERYIYNIGPTNATTEYNCLVDCASNELCDVASFIFNPPECYLYQADGANPGLYGRPGEDVIQRVRRGTGTAYTRATATVAARFL